METIIVSKLREHNLKLALAESCTGGLIAGKITSVPGSSECFGYGVVTYSNEAKYQLLGVSKEVLDRCGAVSRKTAVLMAKGVKKLAQSDIGLSVTGIAGPGGGSEAKPVGLVYLALAKESNCFCEKHFFQGTRQEIRNSTVKEALRMILKYGVK